MGQPVTWFARDCPVCAGAPDVVCRECGERCSAGHVVERVTSTVEGGGTFEYPVWPSGVPGVGMPAWQMGSRPGHVIVEAVTGDGAAISSSQVPDARSGACLHCHRRVAANLAEMDRHRLTLKALGKRPQPRHGSFPWGIVWEEALKAFMPGFLLGLVVIFYALTFLRGADPPFVPTLALGALVGVAATLVRGWRIYMREEQAFFAAVDKALAAAEAWDAKEEAARAALAALEPLDPRDPEVLFSSVLARLASAREAGCVSD